MANPKNGRAQERAAQAEGGSGGGQLQLRIRTPHADWSTEKVWLKYLWDKRNPKDGGSDEWTRPRGSEGDYDPSENEENDVEEKHDGEELSEESDEEEIPTDQTAMAIFRSTRTNRMERLPRSSDEEENLHGSDSDINSSEHEDEGNDEEEEGPREDLPGEWNAQENSKSFHGSKSDGHSSEDEDEGSDEEEEQDAEELPRESDEEDDQSDEEEDLHGSDRDDSSGGQDEENGIYELRGLNCDSHAMDGEEEDARERLPKPSVEPEDSKSFQESESDTDIPDEEEDNDEPHRDEDNPTVLRSTIAAFRAPVDRVCRRHVGQIWFTWAYAPPTSVYLGYTDWFYLCLHP
ncbi:hypothetical protein B0H14DRAFT_3744152 [Mycena olivaceomarginata]|nr:hypothetical protein B0H14DRAFT_3744152 [Mycena olivaceomarginata]